MNNTLLYNFDWFQYNNENQINKKAVHIFKIPIDKNFDKIENIYIDTLSEKELEKSKRFLNIEDSKAYILRKYLLRSLLSKFISDKVPSSIEFKYFGNKKPYIEGIEFNVTRSGNIIIIAIGSSPIGIDIEQMNKDFDFSSLLTTCFDEDEQLFINSEVNGKNNFYLLWTRKEAILKASGEGLIDNLNELNCLTNNSVRNQKSFLLKSTILESNYMMSFALDKTHLAQDVYYWSY